LGEQGILLACCTLKGIARDKGNWAAGPMIVTHAKKTHGGQLTAEGPVAGSPKVILGKDGDV
jgi:hypothetical protein